MEENQIVELWDLFVEFIPEKSRFQAAVQFIEYLLVDQFDINDLQSIAGNDGYLDDAIDEAAENLTDESDESEEDY